MQNQTITTDKSPDYPLLTWWLGLSSVDLINKKTGKPNKLHKTGQIKSIKRTFDTARNHIGRPELRIHDLRHTLGTWMNARGNDINLIKEVLGHADITSTQRYLHVGVDRGREALNETFRFNISGPRE